jgi:hypothetical protein
MQGKDALPTKLRRTAVASIKGRRSTNPRAQHPSDAEDSEKRVGEAADAPEK